MNRLSMSKMALAGKCLYGFRSDVVQYPRPTGRPAAKGRVCHALVDNAVTGRAVPEEPDLTLMAEALEVYEGPLKGYVASRDWTLCEQGYRYDSITDICVDGPKRGEPGYDDHDASVLKGTVDLVELDLAKRTALVVDLKTGKPPTDSEQLYAQAVAISRRFSLVEVRVEYARALKTKLEHLSVETLDADRLDAEAGKIARMLRVLPTSEPNPGDWCWRCDARPGCPAHAPSNEYVPPDMPTDLYDDNARLSF